jgi:hypothetical protein
MIFSEKIETFLDKKNIRYSHILISFLFFYSNFLHYHLKLNISITLSIYTFLLFFFYKKSKESFSRIKLLLNLIVIFILVNRGIENNLIIKLSICYFTIILIEPFFKINFYYLRLVFIILFILEASFTKIKNFGLFVNHNLNLANTNKVIPTKTIKNIGYIFKPNSFVEISTIKDNDTLSTVQYCSNNIGFRVNCKQDNNIVKKNFMCFLGCSFTFGLGVDYNNTFGEIFEKENDSYKSYNFGCFGYGPHQIALQLQKQNGIINKQNISEDDGYFCYTYIDDHLNRVYGGSDYLKYGYITSDVYFENNRLLIKKRSYLQNVICEIVRNSNFLSFFNIKINYPKSEKFYLRFAGIINFINKRTKILKPNSKFIIGIYPTFGNDLNWTKYLDKSIKIIKVKKPIDFSAKKYILKADNHPNGKLNLYYINKIIISLK